MAAITTVVVNEVLSYIRKANNEATKEMQLKLLKVANDLLTELITVLENELKKTT